VNEIGTTLIAVVGGILGGLGAAFLNNFAGEDYRRFRDGAALAGALAGELSSHAKTVPELRAMLGRWTALAESGAPIKMRKFVIPTDPIFDSATAKLGLLGPKLAEELAYVYEQIRVVRGALLIIAQESKEMESDEVSDRLARCLRLLDGSEPQALTLIEKLKSHADRKYSPWGRL